MTCVRLNEQQTDLRKLVQIGDTVSISLTLDGHLSAIQTSTYITATIIGKWNDGDVLLGLNSSLVQSFRNNERMFVHPSDLLEPDQKIENLSDFNLAAVWDREMFIATAKALAPRPRACDSMACAGCGDFVLMAEPNQSDGISFVCYSCRFNPYRNSSVA